MSQQAEKEEKKKGAAPLPLGGGGSGASFSLEQLESLQNTLGQLGMGGSAGAGAAASGGGLAAALASKVGLILVIGMLGAGAMNMRSKQLKLGMKRAAAVKPHYSGDLSHLPTDPDQPDAIQGVVIGDMTRKGDQAAAEAAAAEAAAKAQADADAAAAAKSPSADEAGAAVKAAMASSTKAMKGGDLTARAAKMPLGKGNSPFGQKFGALSTSLGGGSSAASSASFKPNAVAMGQSKSLGGAKGPSGLRALGAKGGGRGGRAFGQLMNINGLSRQGAKVGGESGSSLADQGFSNAAGGGSAITGGGDGVTGQGVFIAHHDTNPNGDPIDNQNAPEGTKAPPTAGHTNATPWQKYVDIAMFALLAAGILLAAAYLLAKAARSTTPVGSGLLAAANVCAYLAIAAGSIAAIMGAIVMGMGQTMNGLMYVAGGALIDYLAFQQLTSEDDKSKEVKASTTSKSAEVGKTVTSGAKSAVTPPTTPAPAPAKPPMGDFPTNGGLPPGEANG